MLEIKTKTQKLILDDLQLKVCSTWYIYNNTYNYLQKRKLCNDETKFYCSFWVLNKL